MEGKWSGGEGEHGRERGAGEEEEGRERDENTKFVHSGIPALPPSH